MKTRTIVFTKPYTVELKESETPELSENQVLVKLDKSTISSGTERANFVGEVNVSIYSNDTVAKFPRISGYSSSGTVAAFGKNVSGYSVGDRVALTWSTHTEYCVIDKNNVHPIISDKISFSDAALLNIATFPMNAIRKCRLQFGESAMVMGLGVLGILALKLLIASGAAPVIAVDPIKEKRELAVKLGADFALDPFENNFSDKVKEITGGGVNVAIEVTGNGNALNETLDCMARFGRVALLGCTRDSNFTVDYYKKVHGPGISLIGAHTLARNTFESTYESWTTHDDVMAIQKLMNYGRLSLSDIVDEIHSPSEASEIYSRLATEKSFPVVQFDWSLLE